MTSRYDRQKLIFGDEGQKKLSEATVGIIGCGGLGSSVITALASAGVGTLVLIDGDHPDITNLNRQFVYREGQKESKVDIASIWIRSLNPDCSVICHPKDLDADNAKEFLSRCDILVDCLDSIPARKILNKYSVDSNKILVHGGVCGYQGQVTVVVPNVTPCLECILKTVNNFNIPMPSVGAAVSEIGSAEALEVIKLITGVGETLIGKLLVADMESNFYEVVELQKDPTCRICGIH
ncbi:MAG: HesA/MoeB/ThiF family protein [Candidatus Methanomethylophilaceae archaeon]|nr:HesA/MoeB/ThiF family protein [Candidatus Methanomethylophilaceae archaeon]